MQNQYIALNVFYFNDKTKELVVEGSIMNGDPPAIGHFELYDLNHKDRAATFRHKFFTTSEEVSNIVNSIKECSEINRLKIYLSELRDKGWEVSNTKHIFLGGNKVYVKANSKTYGLYKAGQGIFDDY